MKAPIISRLLCIIYCRVSTQDLRDNGTSLGSQADACVAFVAKMGWQIVEIVREDYSGHYLDERRAFAHVREVIRAGKADILLCYHPDRLTRNQTHALVIFDSICEAGAELWFAQTGGKIEDSPMGKAMLSLYVTGAAIEREQIRERTMRGRRQRLLNGKIHNAGVALYGYRINKKEGKREVYEPEAAVVREIFRMCTEEKLGVHGITLRLIARGVPTPSDGKRKLRRAEPIWQKSSVYRILRRRDYMGDTVGWTRTTCGSKNRTATLRPESEHVKLPEGITPPLVSKSIWQAAQRQLDTNKGVLTRNEKKPVLLRGHIFCAYCNRGMYPSSERKNYKYRCYSHETPGVKKCANKRISAERVENFAWQYVAAILKDPEIIARAIEDMHSNRTNPQWETDLRIARGSLDKTKRSMEVLVGRMARADKYDSDIFERELGKLKKDRAGLEGMIKELEQRIASNQKKVADLTDLRDYADRERARIENYGFEEKRRAVEQLGIKVYVQGDYYRIDVPVSIRQELNIKLSSEVYGKVSDIWPADVLEFMDTQPPEDFPDPPARWFEIMRSGEPISVADYANRLEDAAVSSLSPGSGGLATTLAT